MRASDDIAGLASRVDEASEALTSVERRASVLTHTASEVAPRVASEALGSVRSRLVAGVEAFGGRGRGGRAPSLH